MSVDALLNNELNEGKTVITVDEPNRTLLYDGKLLLGVERDYQAKRINFQFPRYVGDGIDLASENTEVYIDFRNGKKEPYIYQCTDKKMSTEASTLTSIKKGDVVTKLIFPEGIQYTSSDYNQQIDFYQVPEDFEPTADWTPEAITIGGNCIGKVQLDAAGTMTYSEEAVLVLSVWSNAEAGDFEHPGITNVTRIKDGSNQYVSDYLLSEGGTGYKWVAWSSSEKYSIGDELPLSNHVSVYVTTFNEDDDTAVFSWLLTEKVTEEKGTVSFMVCVKHYVDGLVHNEWHTIPFDGFVEDGIDVTEASTEIIVDDTASTAQLRQEVIKLQNQLSDAEATIQAKVDEAIQNDVANTYVAKTEMSKYVTKEDTSDWNTVNDGDSISLSDGIYVFYVEIRDGSQAHAYSFTDVINIQANSMSATTTHGICGALHTEYTSINDNSAGYRCFQLSISRLSSGLSYINIFSSLELYSGETPIVLTPDNLLNFLNPSYKADEPDGGGYGSTIRYKKLVTAAI